MIFDVLLRALEVCWSGSPAASRRHLEEIHWFFIMKVDLYHEMIVENIVEYNMIDIECIPGAASLT